MEQRRNFILALVVVVALVYTLRLMALQIFDSSYQTLAENSVQVRNVLKPLRGMILDRNGKELATSKPVFDIYVIPKELKIADTIAFCKFFGVTVEYAREKLIEARKFSRFQPSLFIQQMGHAEFAQIEDRLNEYVGIFAKEYTVRAYPHQSLANVLGYIKEVDGAFLAQDSGRNYQMGDLVGKSGLEAQYEEYLRGIRGVKYEMRNVFGVVKGPYMDGKYDTVRVAGKQLRSTIDLELQQYAERLMVNKKGAVVAIEPETGEILVMLSAPSYDPNLLTGKGREVSGNYNMLVVDKHNPLFNRAIMSTYPPGSTFKTLMALIGMHDGSLDTITTHYSCIKSIVNCHNHPSPLNLFGSIQHSCNPFYFQAIRRVIHRELSTNDQEDLRLGMMSWRYHLRSFGLGDQLGIDIPFEKGGLIPSPHYYDRKYRGPGNWKLSNAYSISIGQGELGLTPLQLANVAATIANRGWYITPHVVRQIGDSADKIPLNPKYTQRNHTSIEPQYFDFVARAMEAVVRAGTARRAFIDDIQVCGKTGTAQNPHGEDHSVFMSFAPLNKPKIAIAVYVENAGFGGTWAAPIASLLIEKYIKGAVDPKRKYLEDYVISGDLIGREEKKALNGAQPQD